MMIKQISEQLQNAELVLIGLGEELDVTKHLKTVPEYQKMAEQTENEEILSWGRRYFLNFCKNKYQEIYDDLAQVLHGKNYFVISLCQDGLIMEAELQKERIVQPCGNYARLQCADGCSTQLYDIPQETAHQIEDFITGKCAEEEITLPICPLCGKRLVFNNKDTESYVEEGYLEQWERYKRWLQGTVNKKVCILELGAGMKYPSVIRWPFEKIVFYNQKANLYRVHNRLYQITEEIKERAYGICEEPAVFLKELSNELECDKLN